MLPGPRLSPSAAAAVGRYGRSRPKCGGLRPRYQVATCVVAGQSCDHLLSDRSAGHSRHEKEKRRQFLRQVNSVVASNKEVENGALVVENLTVWMLDVPF